MDIILLDLNDIRSTVLLLISYHYKKQTVSTQNNIIPTPVCFSNIQTNDSYNNSIPSLFFSM